MQFIKQILIRSVLVAGIISINTGHALEYDMLGSTPIGSWQVREDINTDHKGRQTVTTIRTSMLGTETRDGQQYYWIEMVMENFKVSKKGKRKPVGDRAIMKSLMSAETLSGDPANIMTNLRGLGKEIIIQSGDEDPMIIREAGGMFGAIMKGMGMEVNYDFNELGGEKVSVAAGEFDTNKVQGSGVTESKVMFKTMRVESDSTVWMSDKVPFGMIKAEGQSLINGKQNSHSSQLMEFGMEGAKSLITKPPTEMPAMPNMQDILGQ